MKNLFTIKSSDCSILLSLQLVLKASHSWRSNNISGKQIPRINNTITKKDRLFFK